RQDGARYRGSTKTRMRGPAVSIDCRGLQADRAVDERSNFRPRSGDPADPASVSRRDVLKAGAFVVLAASEASAIEPRSAAGAPATGDFSPIKLLFDEPADRPVGAVRWPVTVGVPFANGQLSSIEGLSLSVDGGAAPAQFTKALDWRFGAKTISWVHCDFQST